LPENLLSRYAECIFWLARYVERTENLARILDVNETFSRDSAGGLDWLPIVRLHADEERFFAQHAVASASDVLEFYVLDGGNPTSIMTAVRNARENGRTLRPLISTEMWMQLNMFYNQVNALRPVDLSAGNLTSLFRWIKEACQTHTGITEGTFFRDQAWYFYQIGRCIERADATTRLVDIKYHALLPKPSDVGSPVDASQWNVLLRSAAGYHAYRRLHAGQITPARVTGFLLLDPRFPRSVSLCLSETNRLLTELRSLYDLNGGDEAARICQSLSAALRATPAPHIIIQGLHEFLDQIQEELIAVTRDLYASFFGHSSEARPEQEM